MSTVITLPSGSRVTVGQYVAAWNRLRHASESDLQCDVPSRQWQWYPVKGWEVLRDMREAMHDRINRRARLSIADGGFLWSTPTEREHGRKWRPDWQTECRRLADRLRDRVRIMDCDVPRELRARLAHRICDRRGD